MRNLTADAQVKIAQFKGNEPVIIIEVAWHGSGKTTYTDKDKILDIQTLDDVIDVSAASNSQELSVTLDDADSSIKGFLDTNNIHKRDVWVYQWFEGMDLADKFLLFQGKINSPIVWDEGERTVSFDIVTKLEDEDVGYSPTTLEDWMPTSLAGRSWPMCFGTCESMRPLRVTNTTAGILADGIGIVDQGLKARLDCYIAIKAIYNSEYSRFTNLIWQLESWGYGTAEQIEWAKNIRDTLNVNRADFSLKVSEAEIVYTDQKSTEVTSFGVIGGEDFPRGNIDLKINNVIFNGYFINDIFYTNYDYTIHPYYVENCEGTSSTPYEGYFTYQRPIDTSINIPGHEETAYTKIVSTWKWGHHWGYKYLTPGAVVTVDTATPQKYIVSTIPGVVTKVSAYTNWEGQRKLVEIPENLYSVQTENLGVDVITITFSDALSHYEGQNWEDDIYVTFRSSIGPDSVEILKYLIDNYTELDYNLTSFNDATSSDCNFVLYDRKGVMTFLREIAWQTRSAIYLNNNEFYLLYLPDERVSIDTITSTDIEVKTLKITYTNTEDLVTKMVCHWHNDGTEMQPNEVILDDNIDLYGTQEDNYNFYVYDNLNAVKESAEYWLEQYSNTWTIIKWISPLSKLNLETFDTIGIQNTTGVITSAAYVPNNYSIEFECKTILKAGEQ